MGRLIEYVAAHEVGHTLGFQHNHKASSMYPADKVRDKEWVKKMGHTPTLMDYSRFNYVAQPEDGIPAFDQVARILDPKFAQAAPASGGGQGQPGLADVEHSDVCWPDYSIRVR